MNTENALQEAFHKQPLPDLDTAALLRRVTRNRNRHRVLTAGIVASVTASTGVGFVLSRPEPAVVLDGPAASAAPASQRGLTPAYLPQGATLLRDDRDADGLGSVREWSLPGRANSNTIGPDGVQAPASDLDQHPSTVIQLTARDLAAFPGQAPDLPPVEAQFVRRVVTLRNQEVTVTSPRSGLGIYRLDWVEDGLYLNLNCDRKLTASGPSGIALEELLRVAESLH